MVRGAQPEFTELEKSDFSFSNSNLKEAILHLIVVGSPMIEELLTFDQAPCVVGNVLVPQEQTE
jgi:hypothetical protein